MTSRTTRSAASRDWLGLGFDSVMLAADAAAVVWLRMWRVAAGGPVAGREIEQMISEKIAAHTAYCSMVLRGRGGSDPAAICGGLIDHYGPKVRANRKRLSRR